MPKIGDELRAAREARHLSLSEVSERLHIRSVYLEALENEEWAVVGAPVYVRGFLRAYARFLGVDAESAVGYFSATVPVPGAPAAAPERRVRRRRRERRGPSAWLLLAVVAAAVLVGFVGYNLFELRSAGRHVVLQKAPSRLVGRAAVEPAEQKSFASAARQTLEVRLVETTWLLVAIDGATRLEGTFPAGTRKEFHGKLADIRTGNAGGVDLTVNGKDLGTMGHAGGVVERRVPLNEE